MHRGGLGIVPYPTSFMLISAQWGRIYQEGAGVGQLVSLGVEMIIPPPVRVPLCPQHSLLGRAEGEVLGLWDKASRES